MFEFKEDETMIEQDNAEGESHDSASDFDLQSYQMAFRLASMKTIAFDCLDGTMLMEAKSNAQDFLDREVIESKIRIDLETTKLFITIAFIAFHSRMKELPWDKLRRWLWTYMLQDAPKQYQKLNRLELAREMIDWLEGRIDHPGMFTKAKIIGHSLTRNPVKKRDFYRGITNTALVSTGMRDVLLNRMISREVRENGKQWTSIRIFSEEVCNAFGIDEAFAEGAVNFIPVLRESTKYLGDCLITNVDVFLRRPVDDMSVGQKENLWQVGIDPDYLIQRDPASVLAAREDWIIEELDALIGGLIIRQSMESISEKAPELKMKSRGAVGLAVKTGNSRIMVLAGSIMSADFNETLRGGDRDLRTMLVETSKAIQNDDGTFTLRQPHEFDSKSSAASVLSGRRSAAYVWKDVEAGATVSSIIASTSKRWKRRTMVHASKEEEDQASAVIETEKNSVFGDLLKLYADETERELEARGEGYRGFSIKNLTIEGKSEASSAATVNEDVVAFEHNELSTDESIFSFDDEDEKPSRSEDDDIFAFE